MKIILRLKQFIEYKGIAMRQFDAEIGAANGYIGKQIKNEASVGSEIIQKIVSVYPELSLEWLITGDGTMLKPSGGIHDGGKTSDHVVVSDKMVSENEHLKAELSAKNSQIADLRDHISTLKTQLSECQKRENILLNSVFSDKKTVK